MSQFCSLFSRRLLCPLFKPKSWRVQELPSQRRHKMNPSKQGKHHRPLPSPHNIFKEWWEYRLASQLSPNARGVNSSLHFVTQDPSQCVSCSPQWQRAAAGVTLPLLPAAKQQLFRKCRGTERGWVSINSSAWAMNKLLNTCLVKLISWSTYQQLLFPNSRFPPAVFLLVMSFNSSPKSAVWKRNRFLFILINHHSIPILPY